MLRLEVEQEIRRRPAEAFRFVATDHFANHPNWDPAITELPATSRGDIRAGSTARLVRDGRGNRTEGTVEVITCEPDRAFAAISRFGHFTLRQRVSLRPSGTGGTILRLRIDTAARGPMRLLLPMFGGQFRKTMARSLLTIKRHVEV